VNVVWQFVINDKENNYGYRYEITAY
jgi:hypothetical protein